MRRGGLLRERSAARRAAAVRSRVAAMKFTPPTSGRCYCRHRHRQPRRLAVPRDRADPGGGVDRGRPSRRDPRLGPAAVTVGAVVLTQGRRPAELAAALESLALQRDVELDVVVVGNGWEPSGLPDGVRSVGLEVDRGIPAGRNAGVRRGRRASCCSSSTTTPGWPLRTRSRAWPRGSTADPGLGMLQLPRALVRRRAGAARLGAAAAGRRPGALERRDRGLGGRGGDPADGVRAGRRVAGGVPLRARGRRPRLAGDGHRTPRRLRRGHRGPAPVLPAPRRTATRPTTAPATASSSRAATCRCRSASSTSPASSCARSRSCAPPAAPGRPCAATATACAGRAVHAVASGREPCGA